jgi:thiol-disulfide isomerase/thioredoxin
MRLRTLLLFLCLGALAHAASQVPFPLEDVPIHAAGDPPQIGPGGIPRPPKPSTALIDLKKYRGKAVVVAMISMTCGHCVNAIQYLIEIQKEYGPQGLQVVGVAGDNNADVNLPIWLQRFRPNFPFGYLDQGPFLKLSGLPPDGRPFAPVILFVDPRGVVRDRKFGNDKDMKASVEGAILQGTRILMTLSAPLLAK